MSYPLVHFVLKSMLESSIAEPSFNRRSVRKQHQRLQYLSTLLSVVKRSNIQMYMFIVLYILRHHYMFSSKFYDYKWFIITIASLRYLPVVRVKSLWQWYQLWSIYLEQNTNPLISVVQNPCVVQTLFHSTNVFNFVSCQYKNKTRTDMTIKHFHTDQIIFTC